MDSYERRHRILIVEDNPSLALVVRFNLERAGFSAVTVRDGVEAWRRIQEEDFSLVVTDHQMPGMPGMELCERMRAHQRHAGTEVIMLTAKGLELDLSRLREELGVAAVFTKPFSPNELVRTIQDRLSAGVGPG